MKNKKNMMKGAGILLIVVILVLTSLVIVPMTVAQKVGHDVGVTVIISPTSGPYQTYDVKVTIENFGTNPEQNFLVNVEIGKEGQPEYYNVQTISDWFQPGETQDISFDDWTPLETDSDEYQATACTQLPGDENADNDCLTKTFYITMDFMGLGVAPLGLSELEIIENKLHVSNCESGQNETDGVWTNLEDSFNEYEVSIEIPEIRVKTAQTFSTINNYGINEEGIKIMKPPEDQTRYLFAHWTEPLDTATVEAYNHHVLVFQKEHIVAQITDGKRELEYGYSVFPEFSSLYFGSAGSLGIRFNEGARWIWSEQDVNVDVDFIMVTPENRTGTIVFSYSSLYANGVFAFNVTEIYGRINYPPSKPTIDGPTSGRILTKYNYKIRNSDIESLYYFVDWGDGSNISSIGPYAPGTEATVSHMWLKKGTYTVRVKAMDEQYSESEWETLEVNIPRAKMVNNLFLQRLLERFQQIFPILHYLIKN